MIRYAGVVPICAASCAEWRRMARRLEQTPYEELELSSRPCFDAHVGLGPGVCCGEMDPVQYQEQVQRVEKFLSGQHSEFIDELTNEMQQAAEMLDFERAGRIKGRIDTINHSLILSMQFRHIGSMQTLSGFTERKLLQGLPFLFCAKGV